MTSPPDALVSRVARLASAEGVPSAYAAARDGIDALLRDRGLRRTGPESTAESLLLGAHASAVLEGSTSSLEEVRSGAGDAVAAAAVRVSTELLGLAPVLPRSPLQALARLHTLAAAGSVTPERLGRPRDPEAAARLRELAALLTSTPGASGALEVPALLVAAVAHAELAARPAFASHNGIVARATERLVLVARGVDPPSVTVPEAGHLDARAAYQSNLRAWRDGGPAGEHAWALYAATAYTAGAESSPLRHSSR